MEQNEDQQVADALDAQYQPRFAGDELPSSAVAQAVAIADKLDTITGIYGIGQVPSGDKDPFALRRSALGMLRIIIEKELDLDLELMIRFALDLHPEVKTTDELVADIYDFVISRLKAYFADQGVTAEQFEAVRSCAPSHPLDFAKRIEAVKAFAQIEGAESLSAANKRIANLLKKVDGDIAETVDTGLFDNDAESALFAKLDELREQVSDLVAGKDYIAALQQLATIRAEVDAFFDGVMVMADDESVKNNRLALLNQIYQLFTDIADISRL
jgi:glycyl-tRNA synthetase beta chain